ncbi:MAG: gliding motility-associated C-terminal domain-containing protein [Phaeodactylibacter sp.]|nr:gliding motility-associated C-terminal domain-containing protein [Phaeodactylibacter sp.]MCB9048411.1 gliding motility-associated C-terminal domain-containing protein [Lewinellaceae bacterium]
MEHPAYPLALLAFWAFLCTTLSAQQPFTCRGSFYLAIAPQGSSSVYEVQVSQATGNVTFNGLPAGPVGFVLNGLGYRSTDNFIYAVNSETGNLYRIDANGAAFPLGEPEGMPLSASYPAGDVSPDGKYLVLLSVSGGFNGSTEALIFVGLEAANHPASAINFPTNHSAIYDIAFDPTDETLYGWDALNQRLVIIDTDAGQINTPFNADNTGGTLGSIFFDAFGNLYGYGSSFGSGIQNTFFSIDKTTGKVTIEATGPAAQRSDGCSCPYTVQMKKRVEPARTIPCSELTYYFELANASGRVQMDLTFEDVFPEGFLITAIDNPVGGTITGGGIGTGRLRIENIDLPEGRTVLAVTVMVPEDAFGVYKNQATLSGLPEGLGTVAVSDNPATAIQNDSTIAFIDSLSINLGPLPGALCPGETITLTPTVPGGNFLWSDGSTAPELTVTQGGDYAVTVSSGCDEVSATVTIMEPALTLELGTDREIFLGDSLSLRPEIIGTPPFSYQWRDSLSSLSCTSCPTPTLRPFDDTRYFLSVTDANGCTIVDSVAVQVFKDREVYIPNAFSPNGDGRNDTFFPQSRRPEALAVFRIFSRWGELVFEATDGYTNDNRKGWDGTFKGKTLQPGVYTYVVEVRFLDGFIRRFSGDVQLVR